MKSYLQDRIEDNPSAGYEPFDWPDFFWRIDNTDTYGQQERLWDKAACAARRWVTCACGAQCKDIPRDGIGCPKDLLLRVLGKGFYFAIKERDEITAKEFLVQIEIRSAEILRELKSNQP